MKMNESNVQRILTGLKKLVVPYLNDEDGEAFYMDALEMWDKYKNKVDLGKAKFELVYPPEEDNNGME